MPYKALTYVMVGDEKVAPGDTITKSDLEAAGQTADDIEALLGSGAISEDMDAEVDEAHKEVEIIVGSNNNHVVAGEEGLGDDINA